ncbi:efflux transporter outer membrane subunit [Paucibacter sp. KCTC 42545]|uniref:efflux transporter outer membrane subunit n=1 Tax=Paucibacter sp. KCTC 42545 TaxID=1768242 RepID=UPI0009EB8F2B|nr:efflux transporter outer membrane subunit [Paucibacter sp. KCTC 42545]
MGIAPGATLACRFAGLGLLGSLAACASLAPSEQAPLAKLDMPVAWSRGTAAASAAAGGSAVSTASLLAWWQRFDDAQLDALEGQALQANTTVQGARAALGQARALRDLAAAALWPNLTAQASAQRGTVGGRSSGNNFQLGADASWALDLFGARRAALEAGEAGLAASQASLGDVQVQIAAEVALNYILLRTSQVRSLIAAENLASQEETLQITLWRQQAGLVTALEAEQARAAVEQSRALLPLLQTSSGQTLHALAVLTGRPPAALLEMAELGAVSSALKVPQAREALTLNIPAETLRQRADVRAAEYQVAAALAREAQAQAQRYPSFAIGGSLGWSAATVGALGNSNAVLGSLLASVSLPLFDGGALSAQLRVQQAALTQAQLLYRAAVLAALQQVEDALLALQGARLRLASLRLAADAASSAAQLARQRYSSGLIDFQTVLETQRTQFATQDGVASASAEVGSDQVRLFKALGGGWSPAVEAPNR